MGIKYQLPAWLQRIYPGAIWRGDTTRKVVYLTFDDGPIPEVTPKLLDVLEKEKVHATFFMVADNVTKYPQIYHRVDYKDLLANEPDIVAVHVCTPNRSHAMITIDAPSHSLRSSKVLPLASF